MLIAIASDDAFHLGILSSQVHVIWALAVGGRLGMGNDPRYNKSRCFDPFPFPALEEGSLKQRIRDLGERLDAHRKRQQEQHPDLTLTGIYNVLQKLRTGEALNAKDKVIHDQGLVSVLKQLHDDLDAAVLEAYGWGDLARKTEDNKTQDTRKEEEKSTHSAEHSRLASSVLPSCVSPADLVARGGPAAEALEQAILTRLVALNHERAAEEKRGLVRWLRPDYQNPTSAAPQPVQGTLQGTDSSSSSLKPENLKLET